MTPRSARPAPEMIEGAEMASDRSDRRASLLGALIGNSVIVAPLLIAAFLRAGDSDLYYRSVQEDSPLEWMTFWAFFVAGLVYLFAAVLQRRSSGRVPWFLVGVGLFSVFVAMEEISWGQRVLGYQPPEYFLAENFQQELNIHNVLDTAVRKLSVKGVILGYGALLPLLVLVPRVRKVFEKFGVVAAPWVLAPGFLATFWMYQTYPWRFSGEIVELMLGLGFLLGGLAAVRFFREAEKGQLFEMQWVVATVVIVAILGVSSVALSRLQERSDPKTLAAAEVEIRALASDFVRGNRPISRCGIHKRVFSYMEKYGERSLLKGEFSRLVEQGLPEARAEFFIDIWNTPIWIRHKCSDSKRRQVAFVYSFGPNRRRDSTSWELKGDDIGAMILERR